MEKTGSTRQPKIFCRISDYVAHVDPELAQVIKDVCAEMSLNSMKGKNGITFLLPEDKAFRAELFKLAYSDKVDDVMKALNMLNALIIRDGFRTAAEWTAKDRFLANALYPPQAVKVKSASGKEVVFENGAKAVLDDKFVSMPDRKKPLAVWRLVSGSIPVTTDKPFGAAPKFVPKTGAYEVRAPVSESLRFKIALAIENGYALHCAHGNRGRLNPYIEHVLSLIHYIKYVRKADSLLYQRVLPLISLDNFDFYVLVEPHKRGGEFLLPDDLIDEWYKQHHNYSFHPSRIVEDIQRWLNSGAEDCALYKNRQALLAAVRSLSGELSAAVQSAGRGAVEVVSKAYDSLVSSNAIGGVSQVYPESLIDYYRGEPGLKMLHDELRYLTFGMFKKLEAAPQFDAGAYNELVNLIGECLHVASAEERARTHKILNSTVIKYLIQPQDKIVEIEMFLKSSFFMYFPTTQAEAALLKGRSVRPDSGTIDIPNARAQLYARHARILKSTSGAESAGILAALRSLDVKNLDPEIKAEVMRLTGA